MNSNQKCFQFVFKRRGISASAAQLASRKTVQETINGCSFPARGFTAAATLAELSCLLIESILTANGIFFQ